MERELRSLLEWAARGDWAPHLLASGVLSGGVAGEAPTPFQKRLSLACPTLSRDRKDWAVRELSTLLAAEDVPLSHLQAAIVACAAAKLLVEATRRAGRLLDRRNFTAGLEGLYRFEAGLTPPLTYTQSHRIGASGAYILEVDSGEAGRCDPTASAVWLEGKRQASPRSAGLRPCEARV